MFLVRTDAMLDWVFQAQPTPMIQNLRVKGFRSLRDVMWEPGPLNVLIGPNGSGKSNVLRALAYLGAAATGKLSDAILGAGGIGALLWNGEARDLEWEVTTDPITPGKNAIERDPREGALTYRLRLRQIGESSSYRVAQELLANFWRVRQKQLSEPKKLLERDPHHAVVFDLEEKRLAAHEGAVPEEQTLLALSSGPFGNRVLAAFRDQLESWRIYHDLRVDSGAELRRAAVARHERAVNADGQNLVPVLHTHYTSDRQFKRDIDDAMKAAFGDEFEELTFPPAADQTVQLRVRWRSLRHPQAAADLSDGTLRFLLLLTILATPKSSRLIAIDEPEAGLHPAMLPVVAEFAEAAARHTQVVFTTHSPLLLDAFREAQPSTAVVRCAEGETTLSVVDATELARWLKEYSLGSLFRSAQLEGMV